MTIPEEAIATHIHWIRGEKVMLAHDLAKFYGLAAKRLNEQVNRDLDRFPDDFMLQLEEEECSNLRSQFATTRSWGGCRRPPYAFTEHGELMLSSVLKSDRAIAINIRIMRVLVRMNRLLMNDRELRPSMELIEGRQEQYDVALNELFEAVKQMMETPMDERKRLGYRGGDPV